MLRAGPGVAISVANKATWVRHPWTLLRRLRSSQRQAGVSLRAPSHFVILTLNEVKGKNLAQGKLREESPSLLISPLVIASPDAIGTWQSPGFFADLLLSYI